MTRVDHIKLTVHVNGLNGTVAVGDPSLECIRNLELENVLDLVV
jgi:hypothetical protein